MSLDRSAPGQKRERLRDTLWPGSDAWVWERSENKGFGTIPRLLPLVLHLMKRLAGKGDPTSVYLDLWARVYDEGLVSIVDEEQCAYSAGYTGTRAVRTWREHMWKLAEMGFILIEREGNRPIGQVLILNPLAVCARLNDEGQIRDKGWWTAFVRRASEIGATIPTGPLPLPPRGMKDAVSDTIGREAQRVFD
jgi:hypothetical protein